MILNRSTHRVIFKTEMILATNRTRVKTTTGIECDGNGTGTEIDCVCIDGFFRFHHFTVLVGFNENEKRNNKNDDNYASSELESKFKRY